MNINTIALLLNYVNHGKNAYITGNSGIWLHLNSNKPLENLLLNLQKTYGSITVNSEIKTIESHVAILSVNKPAACYRLQKYFNGLVFLSTA